MTGKVGSSSDMKTPPTKGAEESSLDALESSDETAEESAKLKNKANQLGLNAMAANLGMAEFARNNAMANKANQIM